MINKILALSLLASALFASIFVGEAFRDSRKDEVLYPSEQLSGRFQLSKYNSKLADTRGDTDIFEFQGADSGGTVLILGGTHCDEPASLIAAYVLLEKLSISRGRVIVIPRANHSALTHNTPGEGHPQFFSIATAEGSRVFRMGSRYTNPLDQWPDPEVYVHNPSGQELSGADSRNLNRCFPGHANGKFTEQIAFAISELILHEHIDLIIDMHEASLEYPVINAIVAHERAMECAANAVLDLQLDGLDFALEPSPTNFHGLSHRELGDHSTAFATLMESANVIQGRLRGRTSSELILTGRDPMYERAAKLDMTRVPYDEHGISLEVRVGRHLAGLQKLVAAYSALNQNNAIEIGGLPSFDELQSNGLGYYLTPRSSTTILKGQ